MNRKQDELALLSSSSPVIAIDRNGVILFTNVGQMIRKIGRELVADSSADTAAVNDWWPA